MRPTTLPLNIGLRFSTIGADAFLGVGGLEQPLLQLALERQRRRWKRISGPDWHGALDVADGLARPCAAGRTAGRSPAPSRRRTAVLRVATTSFTRPERLRLLEGRKCGRWPSVRSRGPCRPARASRCVPPVPGSTPSVTSGRPILPPSLPGDAQVGGQRDLEPAADAVAVERGDHQLRRLLEAGQRLVGVQAEVVLEARGRPSLSMPMSAPAQKNFSPAPRSTMTCTASSMRASRMACVELAHHLVGVGVGGRVVEA